MDGPRSWAEELGGPTEELGELAEGLEEEPAQSQVSTGDDIQAGACEMLQVMGCDSICCYVKGAS